MNRILLAMALTLVSVGLAGCDELSARSEVQKGNEAYGEQEFEKAARHFEKALVKSPNLDVAHHNLGITYSRMFHSGVTTSENKAIADKATMHLAKWLDKHPKDSDVRKLLTSLWIDSDEYEKAIEFWKKEHDADPKARDVIQLIAGIYLKSGDWRSAVEWYQKDVDAAVDVPGKVAAYNSIANLTFNRIFSLSSRDKVVGTERTELAEIGIEAAQHGLELAPDNLPLTAISTQLWVNHGTAQGPYWAQAIDQTEAQVFDQRAHVLREQAKKNKPATGAPATGGAPAGNGT